MSEVTRILDRVSQGEAQAAEELLPLVYEELRKLAAFKMVNEAPGQTLQPTALVHEAWLRLAGNVNQHWDNRAHFFAAAAEAMRRILVDNARRKRALRHGGGQERVNLTNLEIAAQSEDDRMLAISEALEELARLDACQAEVVKLRFFIGLKLEEIAALQGVSEKTVQRQWTHARVWLFDRLRPGP
ncbi:MAG TPA: ECF-type sigma factor [Candidatus Paceibacterota bacterium]|nr:ECF-type sigma factor [Verrucomicrobiota bacterium]HRY51580.1 ECF-type sigma factor [Candidatus Paceibacterota bacterium]HSA01251.1 ECF-type sigma factor [Candidatus Paceibacterota bacterium]